MSKTLLRSAVYGLALALAALALWWVYNTLTHTRRPDETGLVTSIHHVNKQIFVEYHGAVIVERSKAPDNWLKVLGIKKEFVVLIRGIVPVGFDLKSVSEGDIWISPDGKRARLILPPPMVFEENVSVDFEQSRILAQGGICPGFICEDSLKTYSQDILPAGRDMLIDDAQRNGVLEQAARDGRDYFELFLKSLGFQDVQVLVRGYNL